MHKGGGGERQPETPLTLGTPERDADLAENKYKRRSATDWSAF